MDYRAFWIWENNYWKKISLKNDYINLSAKWTIRNSQDALVLFRKMEKKALEFGIDAKIHYPIPIYKQTALEEYLGPNDEKFPVTDAHVEKIITFPCDQHLEKDQLDFIISTVAEFYEK